MVRYDTDGRSSRYRLKHPRETRRMLDGLAGFVKTASAFVTKNNFSTQADLCLFSQLRKHESSSGT
jgi:hypothetical protein